MPETFPITTPEPMPFAHVTREARLAEMGAVISGGIEEVMQGFAAAGAEFAGPPLVHYLSFDGETARLAVGFPAHPGQTAALAAAGLGIGETAGGAVMTALHKGPYDSLALTYEAMQAAMRAEGYAPAEDMWERYVSPPETPPGETLTEVIWPLRRA